MSSVALLSSRIITKKGFAPSVGLLRSQLQVGGPLVTLCMVHEVYQDIEPSSSHSLPFQWQGYCAEQPYNSPSQGESSIQD